MNKRYKLPVSQVASRIAALWEEGGWKHSSEEKKINGACQISWSVAFFFTWHQLCLLYSSAACHFNNPSLHSPSPILPLSFLSLPPSIFLPNVWAVGRRYEGGIFSSYKHIKQSRKKTGPLTCEIGLWTYLLSNSFWLSLFQFALPPSHLISTTFFPLRFIAAKDGLTDC